MLLDSPLNKAGLLQIYFRTNKNVLVEVSPQCRIPRTFDRFCGLMGKYLFGQHLIPFISSPTSSQNVYPRRRNAGQAVECDQESSYRTFTSRLPQVLDDLQYRQFHDAKHICEGKYFYTLMLTLFLDHS
jgi:hypothetical protein